MTDNIEAEVAEMQLALGRAISAWAAIEGTLCSTFCIAVTATDRDAAARAFTAILSFEVQLAVTRAAMAVSYRRQPKVMEHWTEIAKRIDKLRPLRNKLAHGQIIIVAGSGRLASVDFLPFHHFGAGKSTDEYEHWAVGDLNKLNDAFLTVSSDMHGLICALVGRGTLFPLSPAPNLQVGRPPFHRRKQPPRSGGQPHP